MDPTVRLATTADAEAVARLLHDFNTEFDTPSPGLESLARRLEQLLGGADTVAVLAGDPGDEVAVALVTLRSNVGIEPDTGGVPTTTPASSDRRARPTPEAGPTAARPTGTPR